MDATTFKNTFMPHHQKMYRTAYRLVEDSSDAKDLVQEAYVKLWSKRNELSHVENMEAYCTVILRNLCLDFLRTKNKYQIQSTEDVIISDNALLTVDLEFEDDINHLNAIIEQLPQQQRDVIRLRHFEEYSNEEIEKLLGLTSVNVRVLLSRARKKIKELFNIQNNYEG
ncbi:MAG: hypothetical protein RL662_1046 [Bacteroidota bacterium]|jgi:RNA polymerase sigma-70 factor (ECF subfamily)